MEGIDMSTLKVEPGDTVVVKVDSSRWAYDEARIFHQAAMKIFENNSIVTILDGVEIAVFHPEENEDGY